MNNISRIIVIVVLFFGILLWVRSCNKITHDRILGEVAQDQRQTMAVINSKDKKGGSRYIYNYSFYVGAVKYSGGTNAEMNKETGDTLSIYYSAKDPTYSYYYNEKSAGYTFSWIDVFVGLILICVFFLMSYLRKMKS